MLPFVPLLFRNIFGFCVVCRVFIQKYVTVRVCALGENGYPSSNNTSLHNSLSLSLVPHTHICTIIVALDFLRTAFPPKNYRCARGSIGSIDMTTHFNAVISRFSIHFFSLHTYWCIRVCSRCACLLRRLSFYFIYFPILTTTSSSLSLSLSRLLLAWFIHC